jgi:hypothetical protein
VGLLSFGSSDGQAVLPTDDGSGWSSGAKGFSLELRTTGVQTYSVRDGAVMMESDVILVNPSSLASVVIRDAARGGGDEVVTHTVAAGESLSVWAAGYDVGGH